MRRFAPLMKSASVAETQASKTFARPIREIAKSSGRIAQARMRGRKMEIPVISKRFVKNLVVLTLLGAMVAAVIAVRKVKAQVSTVQPFTAVEVNEAIAGPGHGAFGPVTGDLQIPPPKIYTRIFAVRSDGSIAIIQKWPRSARVTKDVWTRMIYDATKKTKTFYDPLTNSVVVHPFIPDKTLRGDEFCSGTWDGKIEDFDVVFTQEPLQTLQDGEEITHKRWAAPKLGCFSLKEERMSMHEGSLMYDQTRTMTNIKLGDPDPWYFDESRVGLALRTPEEWSVMAAQVK
jgi:hypothetical protein